jgi:hypothetical protein
VGTDRALLDHAIHAFDGGALAWREVGPLLEDVFIHQLAAKEKAA